MKHLSFVLLLHSKYGAVDPVRLLCVCVLLLTLSLKFHPPAPSLFSPLDRHIRPSVRRVKKEKNQLQSIEPRQENGSHTKIYIFIVKGKGRDREREGGWMGIYLRFRIIDTSGNRSLFFFSIYFIVLYGSWLLLPFLISSLSQQQQVTFLLFLFFSPLIYRLVSLAHHVLSTCRAEIF